MISRIPQEVRSFVENSLGKIANFIPISGGCINEAGRLKVDKDELFLKWNLANRFPKMFTKESEGLKILQAPGCIKIPDVMEVYEGETHSCIILEFIDAGPRSKNYWSELAHAMSCLHRQKRDEYGLDHDNYIGSLSQNNQNELCWKDFFVNSRLQPQLQMAYDSGKMNKADLDLFKILERKLPQLIREESPALTHGDLWSGNLMIGSHGEPVLVDPAVAYTHREMEMAFTTLFGGFDKTFYQTYQEIYPMDPGYEQRFDIYNLYPLLVHVNLFGGGYYNQVKQILHKYTS